MGRSSLKVSGVLLRITLATSPGLRPEGLLGFWGPFVTTVGNTNQMKVRETEMHKLQPLPPSAPLPSPLTGFATCPSPPWLVQLSISPVLRKQQVLAQSEVGAAILKRVQSDLLQQPLRVLRGVDGLAVISSGLLTLSKGAANLAMDKTFITLRERQVPAPHPPPSPSLPPYSALLAWTGRRQEDRGCGGRVGERGRGVDSGDRLWGF